MHNNLVISTNFKIKVFISDQLNNYGYYFDFLNRVLLYKLIINIKY